MHRAWHRQKHGEDVPGKRCVLCDRFDNNVQTPSYSSISTVVVLFELVQVVVQFVLGYSSESRRATASDRLSYYELLYYAIVYVLTLF